MTINTFIANFETPRGIFALSNIFYIFSHLASFYLVLKIIMTEPDPDLPPLLLKLNNYGQNGLNRSIRGKEVQNLLAGYANLADLMCSSDKDAIVEPMGARRNALTHKRLKEFVEEFPLKEFGIQPGARVGVMLPNGPELAVALMGLISQWCAAPINLTNTWEETKSELQSTKAVAIIILTGATGNDAAIRAAEELGLGIITITPAGTFSGLFHLKILQPISSASACSNDAVVDIRRSGRFRQVLVLHTSGTSGNKKLVPYTLDTLMVGVGCIVSSWALQPADVCLNMMPLFHIGETHPAVYSAQFMHLTSYPFTALYTHRRDCA